VLGGHRWGNSWLALKIRPRSWTAAPSTPRKAGRQVDRWLGGHGCLVLPGPPVAWRERDRLWPLRRSFGRVDFIQMPLSVYRLVLNFRKWEHGSSARLHCCGIRYDFSWKTTRRSGRHLSSKSPSRPPSFLWYTPQDPCYRTAFSTIDINVNLLAKP